LAQVVARRGEEAALRPIRPLRFLASYDQFVVDEAPFGRVADGSGDEQLGADTEWREPDAGREL